MFRHLQYITPRAKKKLILISKSLICFQRQLRVDFILEISNLSMIHKKIRGGELNFESDTVRCDVNILYSRGLMISGTGNCQK